MTESAGENPIIGEVRIKVGLDQEQLDRDKARVRSDLEKWEKELGVKIPVNLGGTGGGSGPSVGTHGLVGGGGGSPSVNKSPVPMTYSTGVPSNQFPANPTASVSAPPSQPFAFNPSMSSGSAVTQGGKLHPMLRGAKGEVLRTVAQSSPENAQRVAESFGTTVDQLFDFKTPQQLRRIAQNEYSMRLQQANLGSFLENVKDGAREREQAQTDSLLREQKRVMDDAVARRDREAQALSNKKQRTDDIVARRQKKLDEGLAKNQYDQRLQQADLGSFLESVKESAREKETAQSEKLHSQQQKVMDSAVARKKKEDEQNSILGRNASRMITAYAVARTATAVLDAGGTIIAGQRDMQSANTRDQMINAQLNARSGMESALGQVPIAGQLGIAGRNFFDTLSGNSPADIARIQKQTDYAEQNTAYTESELRRKTMFGPQLRQAQAYTGSFDADREVLRSRRKVQERQNSDALKQRLKEIGEDEATTGQKIASSVSRFANPFGMFGKNDIAQDRVRSDIESLYRMTPFGQRDESMQAERDRAKNEARKNTGNENERQQQLMEAAVGQSNEDQARATTGLRFRGIEARFTKRFDYTRAETARKLASAMTQVVAAPTELKAETMNTVIAEEEARRAQSLSEVGSQYSVQTNSQLNVVGDPSGIRRNKFDPVIASDAALRELGKMQQGMEHMANFQTFLSFRGF